MKVHIHRSSERGYVDYGEVRSFHSFNFAGYFNPLREKFGVIRVINEEQLLPACRIEMPEVKNIEIILIPLKGEITVTLPGSISTVNNTQAMLVSSGQGLDYVIENTNSDESAKLLQIWFFPNIKNTAPYNKIVSLKSGINAINNFRIIAVPHPSDEFLPLQQDAWIFFVDLQSNSFYNHSLRKEGNQVLIFLLEGELIVGNKESQGTHPLKASVSDSVEITEIEGSLTILAQTACKCLIIETPPD